MYGILLLFIAKLKQTRQVLYLLPNNWWKKIIGDRISFVRSKLCLGRTPAIWMNLKLKKFLKIFYFYFLFFTLEKEKLEILHGAVWC